MSWTPEFIERFDAACRKLAIRGRAHFFDEAGKVFVKQIEAGEKLIWPLRFAVEEPKKQKQKRPRRPPQQQRRRSK